MTEYIIRNFEGKEKCVIADSLILDMARFQARLYHEYHYMEENKEGVYNYITKGDETVIPLGNIKLIGEISYFDVVNGELEIIYDAREEGKE